MSYYPKHASEFEIQAYVFAELRAAGYDIRGEVDIIVGRCDLVIFENREPVRVIEIKPKGPVEHDTYQIHKYRNQLGVPIDVVAGMSHAHRYLRNIRLRGFKPVIKKTLPSDASTMCRVDFSTLCMYGSALDHILHVIDRSHQRGMEEIQKLAAQIIRSWEAESVPFPEDPEPQTPNPELYNDRGAS